MFLSFFFYVKRKERLAMLKRYGLSMLLGMIILFNPGHTRHFKYKDDYTIGEDCVPVCKLGLHMHHNGRSKAP